MKTDMNKHKPYGPYERYVKRPLDVACALAAIIVFCCQSAVKYMRMSGGGSMILTGSAHAWVDRRIELPMHAAREH